MDLSSLEGPPIDDPRVVVTPDYMDGRLRIEPPTPDHNSHPSRLWKSLPPRPASAEPSSSSYQPVSPISDMTIDNRPSNRRSDTSLSESQLRRTHAQRGRRTPSPEIDMDINLHMELHVGPRGTTLNERSRSPVRNPVSLLNTNIQTSDRQSGRGRRAQSCCPLVWVEDEQQWVVMENTRQQNDPRLQYSRIPGPSFDRTTQSQSQSQAVNDRGIEFEGGEFEPSDHPPTYESHGFSPTYVRRLGQGRWSEMSYRIHNMPR